MCSSDSSPDPSVMPRRDAACGLVMDTSLAPSATWAAVSVGATPAVVAPSSAVAASAATAVGAGAGAGAGAGEGAGAGAGEGEGGGYGTVRRGVTGGATRFGCMLGL